MSQRFTMAIVVVGILVGFARYSNADDETDARAIVAKGIKALGGEEKLTKLNAHTFKETGTYYGMGDGLPYVGNYSLQYPNQFKMEIVDVFTIVVNGDKGWMKAGEETREMTSEEIKVQRDELYVGWVASLLPLKDKKFKLATTGESKVKDRPVVGVRITSEGHRDVNLFFDKETSLLAKIEHRAIATEQGNKEVTQETFFNDYKDVGGAKVAHKLLMTRDGDKFVEADVSDFQAVGKIDNGAFGKP